ncbi:MAG: hypothetical protein NVSMB69_01280 [Novosphingobium sp.]
MSAPRPPARSFAPDALPIGQTQVTIRALALKWQGRLVAEAVIRRGDATTTNAI